MKKPLTGAPKAIGQPVTLTQESAHLYQGPIPPPEVLQRFDEMVPGAAERLIQLAIDESLHRRAMEQQTLTANIANQAHHQQLVTQQAKAATQTERLSQLLGFSIALTCIAMAFLLANSSPWVAGVFIGIPMASVIRAFLKK